MRNLGGSSRAALVLALALGVGFAACGSDDDDGGSGPNATVAGNLVSAPTAAASRAEKSLFARIAEEMTTFVREAYAQVAGVEGVEVSAGDRSVTTDPEGRFDLADVAPGDVDLRFRRGTCEASLLLPAVANGGTVLLEDVVFECDSAAPARVTEMLDAVIVQKPSSPNGNLTVCVETAEATADRAVQVREATFDGGTFEDLAEGDRVALTGARRGASDASAFEAEAVSLLGPAGDDEACLARLAGEPTPDGEAESTPSADGTDGASGTGGTGATDGTGTADGMDGASGSVGTDGTGDTTGDDGSGIDGAPSDPAAVGDSTESTDAGTGVNDPSGNGFGDVIGGQARTPDAGSSAGSDSANPGSDISSDPNAPFGDPNAGAGSDGSESPSATEPNPTDPLAIPPADAISGTDSTDTSADGTSGTTL